MENRLFAKMREILDMAPGAFVHIDYLDTLVDTDEEAMRTVKVFNETMAGQGVSAEFRPRRVGPFGTTVYPRIDVKKALAVPADGAQAEVAIPLDMIATLFTGFVFPGSVGQTAVNIAKTLLPDEDICTLYFFNQAATRILTALRKRYPELDVWCKSNDVPAWRKRFAAQPKEDNWYRWFDSTRSAYQLHDVYYLPVFEYEAPDLERYAPDLEESY